MSAAILVAAGRSRFRRFDAIMYSGWQWGEGKNEGLLGHLNCCLEYHGQLHENFDNYNVLGDCDNA